MKREYTIQELARAIGVKPTTIHRYVQVGVLPKPPFHGRKTRYTPEHLVRARAIAAMARHGLSFTTIHASLEGKSLDELARLGDTPAPDDTPAPPSPADDRLARAERWSRVPLLPGLDLVLRDDATELVRRIAVEIAQRYASAP